MRQRVALVATLARLYVGVVLIDRECECHGHRRRIVGVVYDHMCQQQCDQRIGYAAGLRPGNMSQIGARSAYSYRLFRFSSVFWCSASLWYLRRISDKSTVGLG